MRVFFGIILILNSLIACSEPDRILPGKREDAANSFGLANKEEVTASIDNAISLPPMVAKSQWSLISSTISKDYPNHLLDSDLSEIWSVSVGKGDSRKRRLTTDPIFFDKKIFTLDANSVVSAFNLDGQLLWKKDLTPEGENNGDIFGGGLTAEKDQIFVTLGYGFLLSLDPTTGGKNWSQRLSGAGNNSPIFDDDLVYLVSGDSKAWAIKADNGRVRWKIDAIGNDTNLISSISPAINEKYAVFGFGNGQIYVTFKKGGYVLWSSSLSSRSDGQVLSAIDDIVASPLIIGRNLYVADGSGKVVSLKIESGERNWTAPFGSNGNFWAAGGSLFFISDTNKLVRLKRKTGQTVWVTELPFYSQKRLGLSKKNVQYYGPIIAGNQLIIASSDGYICFYDPKTGEQKNKLKIKSGATTNPIVVNKTLLLITQDGKLRAFR